MPDAARKWLERSGGWLVVLAVVDRLRSEVGSWLASFLFVSSVQAGTGE